MRGLHWIAALLVASLPAIAQPRRAAPVYEKLRRMPPKDRQRVLQKLPPERAKAVETRIDRLDKMPPEQRERLEERYREFQQLPRERQQAMREAFRRFRELPPDRQKAVRTAFQEVRDLPGQDRSKRLNEFSGAERQLLDDLIGTVPE